jgi:site-specific DNA recombinase
MIKFAFYGRVSTEDQQDPESSRGWQLTRSRALIEACGGVIVTEFFDVDKSRSIPWQRRPQANRDCWASSRTRTATSTPWSSASRTARSTATSTASRSRCSTTTASRCGCPRWAGAIDPKNEAHDLVMSVFGGMSKGERNRIKIRVKAAMGAQAKDEGRFLGGRPPYGYLIADAGPHPNPAKAADGKRLHKLDLDPEAAPVVKRIFAEFTTGHGFYAIAEGLTRDGIPSPSAHDPETQLPPMRHRLEQVRRPRYPHQSPLYGSPGVEQAA